MENYADSAFWKYLEKHITECIKCGGELENIHNTDFLGVYMGMPSGFSYCPECDILKETGDGICSNCHCDAFYNEDRRRRTEIEDSIDDKEAYIFSLLISNFDDVIGRFGKMDNIGQFLDSLEEAEGSFEFRRCYPHSLLQDLYIGAKSLECEKPANVCWLCGSRSFMQASEEDIEKMRKEDRLKPGYEVIRELIIEMTPGTHEHEPADFLEKLHDGIYRLSCNGCKSAVYVRMEDGMLDDIRKRRGLDADDSMESVFISDWIGSLQKMRERIEELMK